MLASRAKDILKVQDKYVLYGLDIDEGMYWLFDIEEGSYFDMNETSYFIISQFDGKKPLSQIKEEFITRYHDADSSTVTNDFDELVKDLIDKEVLITKGGCVNE